MKKSVLILLTAISSTSFAYPGDSLDSSVYVSNSSTNLSDSSTSNGYRTTNSSSYGSNSNSSNSSYRYSNSNSYSSSPSNLGNDYNTVGNNTYGTGYNNRGYSSTQISNNSSVVRDTNGDLHTCINSGYSRTCN